MMMKKVFFFTSVFFLNTCYTAFVFDNVKSITNCKNEIQVIYLNIVKCHKDILDSFDKQKLYMNNLQTCLQNNVDQTQDFSARMETKIGSTLFLLKNLNKLMSFNLKKFEEIRDSFDEYEIFFNDRSCYLYFFLMPTVIFFNSLFSFFCFYLLYSIKNETEPDFKSSFLFNLISTGKIDDLEESDRNSRIVNRVVQLEKLGIITIDEKTENLIIKFLKEEKINVDSLTKEEKDLLVRLEKASKK